MKTSPRPDRTNWDSRMSANAVLFRNYLYRTGKRVDRALKQYLPRTNLRPRIIHRAMRYTALSDGKRLRPVLVVLAYETAGGRGRRADPVAAAVEMVHAFSLIHDDLPAMDDDDFRRGKPTNHKVFGEGVAILAGDALLTQAFQTLNDQSRAAALGPVITVKMIDELSRATGSDGVIGGQVLDLLSEGEDVPRSTVNYIHRHKTARLFAASLRLGALAGEASPSLLRRLGEFGDSAGTAFQIVDDILGAAGSFRELGRDPGRDQARGKVTYPRIVGFSASHRAVDRLLGKANTAVARIGEHRPLYQGFLDLIDARRRDEEGELLFPGEKKH